jgi:hypothetical protein
MADDACPGESTFLALALGRLTEDDRHVLEIHLDQCHDCAALLAALGDAPGGLGDCTRHPTQQSPTRFWDRLRDWSTSSVATTSALLLAQLLWLAVLLRPAMRLLSQQGLAQPFDLDCLIALHVAVTGPLGLLAGLACLFGELRAWRSARLWRIAHAVLVMATVSLLPLAGILLGTHASRFRAVRSAIR